MPDGIGIQAKVAVLPSDGVIEVDLRDNPDCVPSGLNLSEATSRAAALIGLFNSIDHTIPHNQGSFRRVRVLLRENCVVGIPRHPVSCSVGDDQPLEPGRQPRAARDGPTSATGWGLAEVGGGMSPSEAVISGHDQRHGGAPFVNQIFTGPNGDGSWTRDRRLAHDERPRQRRNTAARQCRDR